VPALARSEAVDAARVPALAGPARRLGLRWPPIW